MFRLIKRYGDRSEVNSSRVVQIVALGSLEVAILLTLLLIAYEVFVLGALQIRAVVALVCVAYLLGAHILAQKNHTAAASWLLLGIYQILVFLTLLLWGVNAPVGILAICFSITVTGVLLGSKYIFPSLGAAVALLTIVQLIHQSGAFVPNLKTLSDPANLWDVVTYAAIVGILAYISWLSKNQSEKLLTRALAAEARLKEQKQVIATELKLESAELRSVRLKQMRQLYHFALIGQSATATIHELSNRLAELNLDIDDLHDQNHNSAAMNNTKLTIDHINQTVRQARQQINNYTQNNHEGFACADVINSVIQDFSDRYQQRKVKLIYKQSGAAFAKDITGSSISLTQIITILLNNSLEACQDLESAIVTISLKYSKDAATIYVEDTGPGFNASQKRNLFQPKQSSKPNGLGIGLYIAKHLLKTQFNGVIKLASTQDTKHDTGGAKFIIRLPYLDPQKDTAHE